jgi:hypothetical protein
MREKSLEVFDERNNPMTRHDQRRCKTVRNRVPRESDPKRALELFFALDQRVVELFTSVYKLPRTERFKLREQNRRLHEAVRDHVELVRRAL